MIKNIKDIVQLVRRRDGISSYEAEHIVDDCVKMLGEAIERGASLDDLEGIVADELELEPDYLEIILHNLN